MYICFAEYRILPQYRNEYLRFTAQLLITAKDVQLYEGSDQPGLFVELWSADSLQDAEHIKEERCSERSPWHPVSQWIAGGAAKLHVWSFQPVITSE